MKIHFSNINLDDDIATWLHCEAQRREGVGRKDYTFSDIVNEILRKKIDALKLKQSMIEAANNMTQEDIDSLDII